ncbi:MAG: UDP-2,4-diacetamido-2,4,6-trideoxy-beta-L-altropyranose hydrolase [Vicinamibacterales bacterium]
MNVVIRADASAAIGSGHVMRCLCLADVLHAGGASVQFASRALPDHLVQPIVQRGHRVVALPDRTGWDERLDAEQTLSACGPCDWIVVDHYALGVTWETAVGAAGRLLAIDDLARSHVCATLVDQNFHPDPEQRYAGRVPGDCRLLLGPHYALLRPEFTQARRDAEPRDGEVRRLLVFLGGMDAGNVTETVLRSIDLLDRIDLAVDVVIGAAHPARARIEALCASRPAARCHVETTRFAALLAEADLAIGAGGSATWERCAVGVPTMSLCLADNQREVLFHGSRRGFVYAPDVDFNDASLLALHLRALLANSGLRHHLSRTGLDLVDAGGTHRVAATMLAPDIAIRRATRADARDIHVWRNAPTVRAMSGNSAPIAYAEHKKWLEGVLNSQSRHLLIGERDGVPIGVVRFDTRDDAAEISIYLAPGRIGQGEGTALLLAAEEWLRREQPAIPTLQAQVRAGNPASHRLFERCGYEHKSTQYTKRIGA